MAVFSERMSEHVRAVEEALDRPDAWNGFRAYVSAFCAMQVRDRGIADLVTMDVSAAPEIEQLRSRAFQGLVVQVIERAKAAGALRPDCTPEDILVVLMANAGLVERAHDSGPEASARLVHVLLDGFRAGAATHGPAPPTPPRMRLAMRKHSQRLRFTSRPTGTEPEGR